MLFNSFDYLIFLVIFTYGFYLTPFRHRWKVLLAGSLFFYGCWRADFLLLMLWATAVDYFAALQMDAVTERKKKAIFLGLSLCSNLGLLFFFKYFNFFRQSLMSGLGFFGASYTASTWNIVLPVGISFYTFQSLSYTIDVYRGRRVAEKHLGLFATFIAFFPQLVAGPIERSEHLLPQLKSPTSFSYKRNIEGLRLILWGLFKKVVVADRLSYFVNQVYNNPSQWNGLEILVATYFFAFQIFCDFSGYSDIAVGSARLLGYDIMLNFRQPYFSTSVSEFWTRWHISLSSWFRDYTYISLGGNRISIPRTYVNIFVTFLISGLWHGANWTFVFWGTLNGILVVLESALKRVKCVPRALSRLGSKGKYLRMVITFHLICLTWVFFRADHISDGFFLIKKMLFDFHPTISNFIHLNPIDFVIATLSVFILQVFSIFDEREVLQFQMDKWPTWQRWLSYYVLVSAIVYFGVSGEQFIYFQF